MADSINVLIKNYLDGIHIQKKSKKAIAKKMKTFIKDLPLKAKKPSELTHFFGVAYADSIQTLRGDQNPIKPSQDIYSWDFSVDDFENFGQQGIIPENIKAAGALFYIYELGDHLGIFRLVDMLVLMWAQGRLDINQNSEVAGALYAYYKSRDTQNSPEERAMIYRMVLNIGEGKLLSRMVPNEDFTTFWQQLLSEVTEFIQKTERHQDYNHLVSPYGIFQATRNLQYNLTTQMVGKPIIDTQEMYDQLQKCIFILSHPDIINRLSRDNPRNLWGVIATLSQQEFGISPNISAIRTVAVEGNKIFRWIASFQRNSATSDLGRGTHRREVFRTFLDATKAYILAKEQLLLLKICL